MIKHNISEDIALLILDGRFRAAHGVEFSVRANHFEFVYALFVGMLFQVGYGILDRWRTIKIDGGAACQGFADVQADYIVRPTEQLAYGAIHIGNAPA